MVQTNRKAVNYSDNLLDDYMSFNDAANWTVSAGTGSGQHATDKVFEGNRALKIQNTAPTTDLTITNAIQNTVIELKLGSCYLSFYMLKSSASDGFSGNVKIFKNAVLLDTQLWKLTSDQDADWYRFVSDQPYSLVETDVITFTFTFDGDVGFVGAKTVYIDGMMLHDTGRLDSGAAPPLYIPPQSAAISNTTSSNITSNHTAIAGEVLFCDATSGNITISLPAVAANVDADIAIKKVDSSVNTVTIDGNSTETIDGDLTKVLSSQWDALQIKCNGTEWFII